MADIHACPVCRLRFSDAESPEQVHAECLVDLRERVEELERSKSSIGREVRQIARHEAMTDSVRAQLRRIARQALPEETDG